MILHNAFLNRFYSFATFIESYKRRVDKIKASEEISTPSHNEQQKDSSREF